MLGLGRKRDHEPLPVWWGKFLSVKLPSLYIAQERERSLLMGWVLGVLSIIPDIFATITTGSVTMLTDVIRTATDTLASFLSWLTVRRLARGKTDTYNYGYGKLENLSGLAVAATMSLSFIIIIISAVERFRHPVHVHQIFIGVLFTVIAGITNSWFWLRNYQLAKREPSPVMESQWRLFRSKTFINMCVLIALTLSHTLSDYPWSRFIDPLMSMLLASFLLFTSYQIVSMSVNDLLDRSLEESLQMVIRNDLILHLDAETKLHGIRSRRSGSHVYIEIFLQFAGERKMKDVQALIDRLRDSLEDKIPNSQITIAPTTTPPL